MTDRAVATTPDLEPATGPDLTADEVWKALASASFAVISQVTGDGAPRSSGVLYQVVGDKLYVATAPGSWKARQLAADPRVAVTVTVRRGGLLSLVLPIPPATVSFHGTATVHPADAMALPPELERLVPTERRADSVVIEIAPEGAFVTYGIGVKLLDMREPSRSKARVPVR